jgi:lipopolysaccharide export system permease protein
VRTINRYLTQDYLVIFGMTLLVFTFVMCLGAVIKAIDLGARGISGLLILKVFSYNIPYMLMFSIPISVLTGVLLLIRSAVLRWRTDGHEGQRAQHLADHLPRWCWFRWPCRWSASSSPRPSRQNVGTRCARPWLKSGVDDPISLLEAGRFRARFSRAHDLHRVPQREPGQRCGGVRDGAGRAIAQRAGQERGVAHRDKEEKALYIDLYEVRIDQREKAKPGEEPKTQYINAQHYPVKMDFSAMTQRKVRPKVVGHDHVRPDVSPCGMCSGRFPELDEEDLQRQRMSLVVEANKRLALSLSCFAFTLLGIPLGMRSKRKESSVGVGISLLLVFVFYLFIIIANSLVGRPQFRPDLIVWIPVLAFGAGGLLDDPSRQLTGAGLTRMAQLNFRLVLSRAGSTGRWS